MVLKSEGGMVLNVPDTLTDSQLQGAQMVFYHGASTCSLEWSRGVFAREDELRSSIRAIARVASALEGKPEFKSEVAALNMILKRDAVRGDSIVQ